MFKRIKIRGKLLLLLAAPLMAVLFLAFLGIVDRTEIVDARTENARLAEFAQAHADLSVTFQIERFQTLLTNQLALPGDGRRPDQLATDEQVITWLDTVTQSLGSIESTELRNKSITIRAWVTDLITRERTERYQPVALSAELNKISAELQTLNSELIAEAGDLQLFRALNLSAEVGSIQESLAEIAFIGSDAISAGELTTSGASAIDSATSSIGNRIRSIRGSAAAQYVGILDQLQEAGSLPSYDGGTVNRSGPWVPGTALLEAIDSGAGIGAVNWVSDNEERFLAVSSLSNAMLWDASAEADLASAAATDEARSFLVLAGSVVLFALLLAFMVGRSVSRPLTELTKSAEQLSTEELPAMVESLRTAGRTKSPKLTPIKAKGRDEVASLSRAFSEIQTMTAKVADDQRQLLRRGISDIFVNLARRNQSLLDRQIEFIDQLEAQEENPDVLENLFRLDHLATRMRRNAESLLVLAGTEPARRRGRPVDLADIVRVAMGEIEDFDRIQLLSIDPATVAASVAVDLAHLMSELMENATQFSPPETRVEVVGLRKSDGAYQVTLSDQGIGMSGEQLLNANKTLDEPPIIGLDLSRSLGFIVVSRLAHRRGIGVRIAGGTDGGVSAVVTVPAEMVGNPTETEAPPAPVVDEPPMPAVIPAPSLPPVSVFAAPVEALATFDTLQVTPVPSGVSELATLPRRKPQCQTATAAPPVNAPAVRLAAPDAAIPPEPVEHRCIADPGADDHAVTKAGLIRRTPKQVDVADSSQYFPGPSQDAQSSAPVNRSPDEVRRILTQYRAGLRKGRSPEPLGDNPIRPS
jgi:signal transduction histidine kinase